MKFSDIPGQEHAKSRIREMVRAERIPHALLIHGPEGTGKLALARAMAELMHCEHPLPEGEPCGVCNACKLHESLNHLDMMYVFPVVKRDGSTSTPVADDYMEEWRDFIATSQGGLIDDNDRWATYFKKQNAQPIIYVTQSQQILSRLQLTTHSARYKVVVIWQPDKMNDQTANKLLKVLEEPFADTVFLLVSDHPELLLGTIRSRCQSLEVGRLADTEVAHWLAGQATIHPDDAMALAHVAEGNLVVASRLAQESDEAETDSDLDWFMRLMRLAWQRKVGDLKQWADDLHSKGREREIKFYDFAQRMVRENFVLNFGDQRLSYLSRAEAAFSRNFARFVHERNAPALIDEMEAAKRDIRGNAYGKLVNFDLAMRVILLLKRK